MQWSDEGIVLGARRLGEASVILELMTALRGRQLGVVRGGRSKRLAPVLQPGNRVQATWRARLDDQLGVFKVEPVSLRAAAIIDRPLALFALQVLVGHLRLLTERESHQGLHDAAEAAMAGFAASSGPEPIDIGTFMARFELALLEESGFGLDLSRCAVTGATEGLVFVSPRSGRAVSAEGARGYEERLLVLPALLTGGRGANDAATALEDAFRLTGHFLDRDVYAPRGLEEPAARREFVSRLRRALERAPGDHFS